MIRRPPRSTPFPYPPLFRSRAEEAVAQVARAERVDEHAPLRVAQHEPVALGEPAADAEGAPAGFEQEGADGLLREGVNRSEEHTSELQSRQYLVCRLLLEKK